MKEMNDQKFLERLNQHPKLRNRMEALLNIVENTAGDCKKADDAEEHVIDELRKMGNDALHCWADNATLKAEKVLREEKLNLHRNGKKKSGGIPLLEK